MELWHGNTGLKTQLWLVLKPVSMVFLQSYWQGLATKSELRAGFKQSEVFQERAKKEGQGRQDTKSLYPRSSEISQ